MIKSNFCCTSQNEKTGQSESLDGPKIWTVPGRSQALDGPKVWMVKQFGRSSDG